MQPKTGTFLVANYETAQPAGLAYDQTPYCWLVETRVKPATDTAPKYITADLAGFSGKARYRQLYAEWLDDGINHTEVALHFMRAFILPANAHAQLVSMANTSKGMIFVFI